MTSRKFSNNTTMPISNLIDGELRRADGVSLGVVDELLIDLHSGRVEYLIARGRRGERRRYHWHAISVIQGRFVVSQTGPKALPPDTDEDAGR